MVTAFRIILFILLLAAPAQAAQFYGSVLAVLYGDTIIVRHAGQPKKIRLWGIDAPEYNQSYRKAATAALKALTHRKRVKIKVVGWDRYRRTLALVYVGKSKKSVNLQMIELGAAWWYEKYSPDATMFKAAEAAARTEKRGLWTNDEPKPPWKWRKRK